ncbi:MAG: protein-L-isoaspartate(D-aspartate) O-methyltransferase [Thermoprotei archaeon]
MYNNLRKKAEKVIKGLYEEGFIKRKIVLEAMLKIPREEFVPPQYKDYAYVDTPIPIGEGQTVSALHMTAMMCEYAELKPGMRILEIGTGSGYMASVYSSIVCSQEPGIVITLEISPYLAKRAWKNIVRLGYGMFIDVIVADGSIEPPLRGNFDAIIVTAAASHIPEELVGKLENGGRLVIPVGTPDFYQELMLVHKDAEGKVHIKSLGAVAFVPLRGLKGISYGT